MVFYYVMSVTLTHTFATANLHFFLLFSIGQIEDINE